MPYFAYKATDAGGRIIKGGLEAADDHGVVAELDKLGYIPIRIQRTEKKQVLKENKSASAFSFKLPERLTFQSGKETMVFTQDLSSLLAAGLPLDRALEILIETSGSAPFRRIIRDILHSVQKGHYLSDALIQHPRIFSVFYINMVRAGEAGGILEDVLSRLATFLETVQELKEYIKSAMLYPAFLVGVGGISIFLLLTFVIPRFSMIFDTMGRSIPLATQLLLSFSEILKTWWWLIGIVLAGCFMGFHHYARTETGRLRLDTLKLKIPIMHDLIKKIEIARFSRTLGTLIHSGVPILKSLELVKEIISNRVIASSLDQVHSRIKEGEKLAGPLAAIGIFPSLAIQMITVGEETGRLDEMLLRVAENYEKIVRDLIKRYIGMLEPVMILVMGVVIGFIVISMLMAIFSMNDLPF
ncbi:MAG: type II secretion system F family protein [Deltaproteobacteria bacterium]|nr:type II secretion system F family protein [Deltaproteobacteria bacterium]